MTNSQRHNVLKFQNVKDKVKIPQVGFRLAADFLKEPWKQVDEALSKREHSFPSEIMCSLTHRFVMVAE